jgi:hypothetical protein
VSGVRRSLSSSNARTHTCSSCAASTRPFASTRSDPSSPEADDVSVASVFGVSDVADVAPLFIFMPVRAGCACFLPCDQHTQTITHTSNITSCLASAAAIARRIVSIHACIAASLSAISSSVRIGDITCTPTHTNDQRTHDHFDSAAKTRN